MHKAWLVITEQSDLASLGLETSKVLDMHHTLHYTERSNLATHLVIFCYLADWISALHVETSGICAAVESQLNIINVSITPSEDMTSLDLITSQKLTNSLWFMAIAESLAKQHICSFQFRVFQLLVSTPLLMLFGACRRGTDLRIGGRNIKLQLMSRDREEVAPEIKNLHLLTVQTTACTAILGQEMLM